MLQAENEIRLERGAVSVRYANSRKKASCSTSRLQTFLEGWRLRGKHFPHQRYGTYFTAADVTAKGMNTESEPNRNGRAQRDSRTAPSQTSVSPTAVPAVA